MKHFVLGKIASKSWKLIHYRRRTLTLFPYADQHGHHNVFGQFEMFVDGENCVPQKQQIQHSELSAEQQTQPSSKWENIYFNRWPNSRSIRDLTCRIAATGYPIATNDCVIDCRLWPELYHGFGPIVSPPPIRRKFASHLVSSVKMWNVYHCRLHSIRHRTIIPLMCVVSLGSSQSTWDECLFDKTVRFPASLYEK